MFGMNIIITGHLVFGMNIIITGHPYLTRVCVDKLNCQVSKIFMCLCVGAIHLSLWSQLCIHKEIFFGVIFELRTVATPLFIALSFLDALFSCFTWL